MADTFSDLVARLAPAEDLALHLDALPAPNRVEEVLALPGKLQPKLFELVKGKAQITIDEFVPKSEETIIYELKNDLPLFNISQKRFFKPAEGEVIGYNHTDGLATTFAGPGYFFAGDKDGELVFDYTRLPTLQPEGWPQIKPNKGMLRGVVYGEMIDYCRRVSEHTVIGAAFRHGKPRNAYFILTRCVAQS